MHLIHARHGRLAGSFGEQNAYLVHVFPDSADFGGMPAGTSQMHAGLLFRRQRLACALGNQVPFDFRRESEGESDYLGVYTV